MSILYVQLSNIYILLLLLKIKIYIYIYKVKNIISFFILFF